MLGKPIAIVHGEGADLNNKTAIRNRAKKKQISQVLSLTLAGIATESGNDKLAKTLWNSYYCLDSVQVSNGRIYGKYCKNRICTVCLGIRKAEMIHKYLPVLLNWEEPHFVTLTVKAVSARSLKKTMERMNYGLNRIIGKYKKRNQRGKSERLIGIRSLECNFNPIARTYNPHFHLIVPNCKTGDLLIQEWLMTSRKGKTAPWAQKNLRVFNNEKCLIEIVKYGSKIFTEPDIDKKKDSSLETKIYARALYTIIEAMQGHRIFERFGFNLPKTKKPKSTEARLLTEFAEFNYDNSYLDWMNSNTNEQLTNYSAERKLNYLLEYNIDNELN